MARQSAVAKRDPDVIPTRAQVRRSLKAVEDKEKDVKEMSERERRKHIKDFAEGLKTSWLQCRELGHVWKPYHVQRLKGGAFLRTLRCSRCTCRREQELSSRGAIISNTYKHPEGYLRKGFGAIVGEERDIMRLASIMRLDIKEGLDEA
jgi:hypothetical protein